MSSIRSRFTSLALDRKPKRWLESIGEGLVLSIPPDPGFMYRALNNAQAERLVLSKTLNQQNFYTTSLTTAVILEPGESFTSERVLRECGAFVIASLHYVYDKIRQFGGDPPGHLRHIWDEYRALVEKTPPSRIVISAFTTDIVHTCCQKRRNSLLQN